MTKFKHIAMLYFRRFTRKVLELILPKRAYARMLGVKVGQNTMIATKNWPTEPYLIEIGNNCQITKNVYFHTHGGAHAARRIDPKFDVFGKIKIEDNVYIGCGSQIMPGVTIGEGALITAGSIVCKSVTSRQVWGGAGTIHLYGRRLLRA